MSSICPRGWSLIGYIGNRSFIDLTTIYLDIDKNTDSLATTVESALRAAPSSFVRSGRYLYNTSTLYNRGSGGFYWSSRANSTTNTYCLYFGSTGIYPQDYYVKGYGFSVRCVAR